MWWHANPGRVNLDSTEEEGWTDGLCVGRQEESVVLRLLGETGLYNDVRVQGSEKRPLVLCKGSHSNGCCIVAGWGLVHIVKRCTARLSLELEEDKTDKRNSVTAHLDARDRVPKQNDAADNEKDVLDDTSQSQHERRCGADEEDGCDVEAECDTGVAEQNKRPQAVELEERLDALREDEQAKVDGSADGRKVVQAHEGVHLEALQQHLYHDQAGRLKANGQNLRNEARHDKVNLAVRCGCNTDRDQHDDRKKCSRGLLQAERKRDEQDCDRHEGLYGGDRQSVPT